MAFKSTNYMFLSKIYGPASGGADLVAYNYFTRLQTGVTYEYSYTRNWIAIGQQQWGYEITFTAKTIVFPCPYAEIIPSVIGASSGSSAKLAINANSLTSFNASNQAAQTIWWIAIGKQQWGYGDALKWPGLTIELPIPFSNSVYATVAMGCPTTYFWDYPAQIKLNGLTEISYGVQQGVSEDKMFWLIIGQQRHKGYWHNLCRLCLDQHRQ